MIPNIYISAPVTLDWAEVMSVSKRINLSGFNVRTTYWDRKGYYNRSSVSECDIFVFMTPNNDWEFNMNTLPVGVKREYEEAIRLNKPVFMVYRNMEGDYNLYLVKRNVNTLSGLQGSSGSFWVNVANIIKNTITTGSANTASNRNVVFDLPATNALSQFETLSEEQLAKLRPLTPNECTDYDPRLLL
jgi:3-methyladenine DNA glycosylase AlkC